MPVEDTKKKMRNETKQDTTRKSTKHKWRQQERKRATGQTENSQQNGKSKTFTFNHQENSTLNNMNHPTQFPRQRIFIDFWSVTSNFSLFICAKEES